jgi:hypothetical protein
VVRGLPREIVSPRPASRETPWFWISGLIPYVRSLAFWARSCSRIRPASRSRHASQVSPSTPRSYRRINLSPVTRKQKRPVWKKAGRLLPVESYLDYGCAGAFAFAASILLFNAICCSGVSTLFTLVLVASWISFIFAFFWSSLSEASFITV